MSAAIGLSHNMFDGALYLGVCDKIVPGLTMAALSFGHLPSVFIPSGPMASGLPNKREGSHSPAVMQKGKLTVWRCWSPKPPSYHAPGTCTFYGTANTNQMVVEFMEHAAAGLVLCPSGCSAAGSTDRRRRAPGHPHDRQRQ